MKPTLFALFLALTPVAALADPAPTYPIPDAYLVETDLLVGDVFHFAGDSTFVAGKRYSYSGGGRDDLNLGIYADADGVMKECFVSVGGDATTAGRTYVLSSTDALYLNAIPASREDTASWRQDDGTVEYVDVKVTHVELATERGNRVNIDCAMNAYDRMTVGALKGTLGFGRAERAQAPEHL